MGRLLFPPIISHVINGFGRPGSQADDGNLVREPRIRKYARPDKKSSQAKDPPARATMESCTGKGALSWKGLIILSHDRIQRSKHFFGSPEDALQKIKRKKKGEG